MLYESIASAGEHARNRGARQLDNLGDWGPVVRGGHRVEGRVSRGKAAEEWRVARVECRGGWRPKSGEGRGRGSRGLAADPGAERIWAAITGRGSTAADGEGLEVGGPGVEAGGLGNGASWASWEARGSAGGAPAMGGTVGLRKSTNGSGAHINRAKDELTLFFAGVFVPAQTCQAPNLNPAAHPPQGVDNAACQRSKTAYGRVQ